MPLTPLDIHNKEFSRAFRGYREDEVDEFLDVVVREFEALLREIAALRDRVQELDKGLRHYRNLEETLNRTVLVAQETAREVKANAEKEALLTARKGEQQAAHVVEEAQARMARAYAEYDELRRRAQVFRVRMRNFLESQIELFQETAEEGWSASPEPGPEPPEEDVFRPGLEEAAAAPEEPKRPPEEPSPRRHWLDDLLDDEKEGRR